jgi:hypothetical protein
MSLQLRSSCAKSRPIGGRDSLEDDLERLGCGGGRLDAKGLETIDGNPRLLTTPPSVSGVRGEGAPHQRLIAR